MKLSDAIAKQEKALETLKKTHTNMRKKGLRKGNVDSYLKGLESRWRDIQALNEEIEKAKTAETAGFPYFDGWFENAEEEFFEQRGLLLEALYECEAAADPTPSDQQNATIVHSRTNPRKLPHMELPKFAGNYTQWASFKDLFLSMMSDRDLTDVDRLQYLKASLTGEAAQLIKNIQVTADNYKRAWKKLTDQYGNTRLIVNSCLNSLFQLQPLNKESEQGLQSLRGTTNDIIEILTTLNRPVEHWDDFLIYLTVQRLDPKSRRDWETLVANTSTPSTYEELDKFLMSRIQALKSIEHGQESLLKTMSSSAATKPQVNKSLFGKASAHNTVQQLSNVECKFCKQNHFISYCENFKALDVIVRKEFVTNNRLCYNCLGARRVKDCRSKKTCYHCQGRRHSLLHFSGSSSVSNNMNKRVEANVTTTPAVLDSSQEGYTSEDFCEQTVNVHTSSSCPKERHGLIFTATAQIIVSVNCKKVLLRALIDPCSDASFIKESIVQLLKIPKRPVNIQVGGVGGGTCQRVRAQARVHISPRLQPECLLPVSALILSKLSDYLPPRHCLPTKIDCLEGLKLADPYYGSELPIDMILGLDIYTQIILPGLRKSSTSQVIAQETSLGWIISGKCAEVSKKTTVQCHTTVTNEELIRALNKFWDQEEVTDAQLTHFTQEEITCEKHFLQTVQREKNGRYILRLPFNDKIDELADSYHTAERMLLRMEKKFELDADFFKLYNDFIEEYIQLGHADYVNHSELVGKRTFFLPHHGVLKGNGENAKIRVVFNGSVRLSGPSLNDCLYTGPKLLRELRNIIQLWRLLEFVWSADAVKMFRQILIHDEDCFYLLILWRRHPSDRIRIIRLKIVTYGLVCAPYQALKTLEKLSQDEGNNFPLAKEVVDKKMYMDDAYGGSNNLEEALEQQQQFVQLLKAGGFQLSKWAANHSRLLENVSPENTAHSPCTIEDPDIHSVLGLVWHPASDAFTYKINWSKETPAILTKRNVHAQAAKFYDPLGWISPITITLKIFLQSLWTMGIQWDDPIPNQRAEEWRNITEHLQDLSQISIPRHVGHTQSLAVIELHGFADASERAMAAVLYLRVRGKEGRSTCNILISKTKVAPLKQISLPRLELNAAFILANLVKNQVDVLSLQNLPKFLWSDSTVALSWIQGHPTRWTTYVANRVSSIQAAVPDASWSHMSGHLNPADLAPRGTTVCGLLNADFWLAGPDFLKNTSEPWKTDNSFAPLEPCPEERRIAHASTNSDFCEWELIERYSTLDKLLRITARCQEYLFSLKRRLDKKQVTDNSPAIDAPLQIGILRPEQLIVAELFWIKHIQAMHYKEELSTLKNRKCLSKKSKLLKLHPFIDDSGLLRISGRLRNAMNDDNSKHPFILPKESAFSLLLIRNAHLRTLHGGTQLTLSTLRQRYWIVAGRSAVKAFVSLCVVCWKQTPPTANQLMGDLPAHRVRPARAFLHAGVDYAGPILLRASKGRGIKSSKGYIVIFVCLATRAVHLEVASDYTSEEFIAVYKRFAGRRGLSATLYSDCGTNFVGANRQLRALFEEAGENDKKIEEELIKLRTTWKFNPASAPHFGGLWESGVKIVKYHLKRVLGDVKLTFEELTTLLIQIEACLNSRPLQPLSDDPTDLNMLTPAHFLIGEPLNLIPEPSLLEIHNGRLTRWQLIRKMTEDFWRTWTLQYLPSLQQRNKWNGVQTNVKVGDICKIKVETTIPCK